MKYFIRKTAVLWVLAAAMLAFSCKGAVKPGERTIAVTGVSLNKTELSLVVGSNETLTATVEPATATNKAATWKSSKPAIAEVDETGKVTAKQVGTATITVTTKDGGKTAICEVKVLALYFITYELNGGTDNGGNPASYTVETDTITLKPVNKANHIFFGWYEKADFSGSPVTEIRKGSHGDKELYAQLIEIKMIDIAAVTDVCIGDDSKSNNKVHTVSLTAYRIGETEVTQELWKAVMGKNPSFFDNTGTKKLWETTTFDTSPASGEVQGKRPVEQVSWYDCIVFCNELTKKVAELGEDQCVYSVDGHTYTKEDAEKQKVPEMDMSKKGFRLPTEAEWEWAAKGGKEDKWAGTDEETQLVNYTWYSVNGNKRTHEVKKKAANGYGLYNMTGNVWEWCWDIYSDTPAGGKTDPTGAASGDKRIERGGNFDSRAGVAFRATRHYVQPNNLRAYYRGLRLVRRS